MYTRTLKPLDYSFFLFGPRGAGKSTWIRACFQDALIIDLLPSDNALAYAKEPSLLRGRVQAMPQDTWVVIDEIQKVPSLLDEVHDLMENHGYRRFVLSGSSARKLKRGGANLLAGRVVPRSLFPLTTAEAGDDISPEQALRFGCLPLAVQSGSERRKEDFLKAYVTTYLAEEIKAEGHVRHIGDFARFLDIAALVAGSAPNLTGLARDAGIGRDTVQGYFSVFEDTLLGRWLPAYRPRAKVKEVASPKFYWFDPGVLNAAAGAFDQPMPADWQGVLMEHWVHLELSAYLDYGEVRGSLGYWATPHGTEVDFVHWYGEHMVAIEVKAARQFRREYLRGLQSLSASRALAGAYLVYLGKERLRLDGVDVVPAMEFFRSLHAGQVIPQTTR